MSCVRYPDGDVVFGKQLPRAGQQTNFLFSQGNQHIITIIQTLPEQFMFESHGIYTRKLNVIAGLQQYLWTLLCRSELHYVLFLPPSTYPSGERPRTLRNQYSACHTCLTPDPVR